MANEVSGTVRSVTRKRNGPVAQPLAHRIQSSIVVNDEGCWVWQKYVKPNGYAQIGVPGRGSLYAHRVSYETFVGPIPDGLHIDHTCHTRDSRCVGITCPHRRCVNPGHLEPVTPRTNNRRGSGFAADHARVTVCPQGHRYDSENTYVAPNGSRDCRRCRADAWSRHRKRRMAEVADIPVAARQVVSVRTLKTECHAGHAYSGENLYVDPCGGQQCRECRREASRRSYAKRQAKKAA